MDRPGVASAGKLRASRVRCYLLLLGVLCFPVFAGPSEAALRAAFVFNFIKFIDWPEVTQAKASSAFQFCVVNASGETREALQNIHGKLVKNHTIGVVYLQNSSLAIEQFQRCQILYVPIDHSVELPPFLPPGVVLVADELEGNESNVSISIWKQKDSRIAFSVHEKAVNQAGVSISSQLLKLAQTRREGE